MCTLTLINGMCSRHDGTLREASVGQGQEAKEEREVEGKRDMKHGKAKEMMNEGVCGNSKRMR